MKLPNWLKPLFVIVPFFLLIVFASRTAAMNKSLIPSVSLKWSDVLFLGIPGLEQTKQNPVKSQSLSFSRMNILRNVILSVTDIDIANLKTLMSIEIAGLSSAPSRKQTVTVTSVPNKAKFTVKKLNLSSKPIVGIYHTHTSESFIPSSGYSHRRGGNTGDIVTVGEAAVQKFATNGIKAIQSKAIHDYPSFMKAYGASELTVKKMLQENPSIEMIFDIHRDADKRESITAMLDDQTTAKILIVVAQGQPDLPQPHWEENYAFAQLIDKKLQQHYPGVSRGIQLVDWRYNQHLHRRALLIEVGSQESTIEEAIRSIEIFADVVSEIIAEGSDS